MKAFKNYEEFLSWAYEIKDENGFFPRLKLELKEGFFLETEPTVSYKKVMDCLYAHEEG